MFLIIYQAFIIKEYNMNTNSEIKYTVWQNKVYFSMSLAQKKSLETFIYIYLHCQI